MSNSNSFLANVSRGIQHNLKKYFHNKYKEVNISWLYLKYLKHIPPGKEHYHKLFNHKTIFSFGPEYLHGINEVFIEEVYKQVLPDNARVLDCGAHIGLSVIYLKRLCPTAKITAFEPDDHNFRSLQFNIKSHNLTDVMLLNEAVWTENTLISFKSEGNMSSKIELNTGNTNKIKAVRLKDFLNEKVHFLKLDIEGAEFEVMKDIQDRLSMIENLFIEYHGSFEQNNELNEMLQMVSNNGFKYYIKEATSVYDHPFLREKSDKPYNIQLNIFCFR